MADPFDIYGQRQDSWRGKLQGHSSFIFFIYKSGNGYIGLKDTAGKIISQQFDHFPTQEEVEIKFRDMEK